LESEIGFWSLRLHRIVAFRISSPASREPLVRRLKSANEGASEAFVTTDRCSILGNPHHPIGCAKFGCVMASVDPHSRQQFDQQPMSVVNTNQPRPHVRRATYIHVSDLTNAYNIDHARLEEELARVKEELENPVPETKNRSESLGSVPTELDTSYPQKRLQPPRGGNNMVV